MKRHIRSEQRGQVRNRAKAYCEYCRASEWLTGQTFHIDHIVPRKMGGTSLIDNLCYACPGCNGAKSTHTTIVDPDSKQEVQLFHPRQQKWGAHFRWDKSGIYIVGITPIGRATVATLKLNRPLALTARAIWISANRHPPAD